MGLAQSCPAWGWCRQRVQEQAPRRCEAPAAGPPPAQDIRIHPKFWYRLHYYDIALMKLDKPVRGVPLAGLASPSTVGGASCLGAPVQAHVRAGECVLG